MKNITTIMIEKKDKFGLSEQQERIAHDRLVQQQIITALNQQTLELIEREKNPGNWDMIRLVAVCLFGVIIGLAIGS